MVAVRYARLIVSGGPDYEIMDITFTDPHLRYPDIYGQFGAGGIFNH